MGIQETLAMLNPWWDGERSPVVREWESRSIRWRPGWLDRLCLRPYSLNIVVGPRLVGKTTGLHLLIEEQLRDRDPHSILYLNLDLAADLESFRAMLDAYLRMREARGVRSSLIVLDEVTGIPGWWRLVKGYVDAGIFERDVVVLTGISSLRLRGEVELFPGRMGGGREVTALPLSFREYLVVRGVRVEPSETPQSLDALLPQAGRIRILFQDYLRTGGYPLSINGDPRSAEYLIRSLEGEVLRAGRGLDLTRGIISRILEAAPSPISFNSIASSLSISHRTVREYVDLLSGLMILGQALFFQRTPKFRKERKFFLRDPHLARVLSMWTATDFLHSALYEWVVQEHLLRRFGEVYYWRNGYEVDALANGLKVEVKAGKPHRRYPRGVIVLGGDDLPLFLAQL